MFIFIKVQTRISGLQCDFTLHLLQNGKFNHLHIYYYALNIIIVKIIEHCPQASNIIIQILNSFRNFFNRFEYLQKNKIVVVVVVEVVVAGVLVVVVEVEVAVVVEVVVVVDQLTANC